VWFNNTQTPLKEIINHGDITSGLTVDNKIITIIPVDYLCWSEKMADAARFHEQVFEDIDSDSRELWIVGDISERATLEFTNLGWEVHQQVSIKVEQVNEKQDKGKAVKEVNKRAFDVFKDGDSENNDLKDEDQNNQ